MSLSPTRGKVVARLGFVMNNNSDKKKRQGTARLGPAAWCDSLSLLVSPRPSLLQLDLALQYCGSFFFPLVLFPLRVNTRLEPGVGALRCNVKGYLCGLSS